MVRGRDPKLPRTRGRSENIAEAATAGYRVFIAGKEITKDVESLRIQLHDGSNQTSLAQIVLNNELDKYIVAPDEMAQLADIDLSNIVFDEINNKAKQFSQLTERQKQLATGVARGPRGPDLFNGARPTSSYGERVHPVTGERSMHYGVDYAAKTGEPVISPYNGEVFATGPGPGESTPNAGNYVVIKTADNHFIRLFHFDSVSPLKKGDKVEAGKTVLGPAGSSGRSTGPHIHLEIRKPKTLRDGTVVPDRSSSGSIDPATYPVPGPGTEDSQLPPIIGQPFEGYKRADDEKVIDAETLEDLVENELPRLASELNEDLFSRVFPGEINKIKRELLQDKFFRGKFISNDKFIFLDDLNEEAEESNKTGFSRGPLPRLNGWAPRYQIYAGSCVFHTQDPIRIFLQDPYDPYVWYYGFTGYITDESDVLDVNGNKTVSLTCEDVTRPFKYSRFTINPQIANPEVLTLVTDTIIYSGLKEPFQKLTIPESILLQVFGGQETGITNEDLGIEAREPPVNSGGNENIRGEEIKYLPGVGDFDLKNSKIFIYGDEQNPAFGPNWNGKKEKGERKFLDKLDNLIIRNFSLPEYQATVDLRVRYEDLRVDRGFRNESRIDARADKLRFYEEVISQEQTDGLGGDSGAFIQSIKDSPIWKTMSYIGENPDLYPIDGRVIMILPGSINPTTNTRVLMMDFSSFSVTETNFSSKFNILKMYAERLDFSLFATPRGDLLFEMPFYDFHPDDFNVDTSLPPGSNRNVYTFSRRLGGVLNDQSVWPTYKGDAPYEVFSGSGSKSQSSEDSFPSYAHAFTISKNHQIGNYTRTFSDAAIRTLVTTSYFTLQNISGSESSRVIGTNISSVAESLVPSFGARHEIINSKGYIATPEAAKLYADIQLNKLNSAATQIQCDIDAKFDLFINRPIRIEHKEILGTLRSVTHEVSIGSRNIGTSTMQLNNARIWTGGIDRTKNSIGSEYRRVYEPIGTEASKAINYNTLFERSDEKDSEGKKKKITAREPKE